MKQQSEYTEYQIDRADDELERIIELKRDLSEFFIHVKRCFPDLNINEAKLFMQENFDELFHAEWNRQTEISSSIGWPNRIPPFETLSFVTPKQRLDREWAKNNRPVPTNPSTRFHYIEPRSE